MLCGWEGKCKSGIVLAVHCTLNWFIHIWPLDIGKGDEHPTYAAVKKCLLPNITFSIVYWVQVRMAALGVLNALFDGTKQFLMVAEDRFASISGNYYVNFVDSIV